MRVHWDFTFENTEYRMSGDLIFDTNTPHFLAHTSISGVDELHQLEKMMRTGRYSIQVVGTDSKLYCLYNCHINSISQHFSDAAMVATLTITFELVIKQNTFNKAYRNCCFTFPAIEKLFPLTRFHVSLPNDDENLLTIQKELDEYELIQIADNMFFKAESCYEGIYSSDNEFNINITPKKRICLNFNRDMTVEQIVDTIEQFKEYFELIYHSEIHIMEIQLDYENVVHDDSILFSQFDKSETTVKFKKDLQFRGSYEQIVAGLIGWLKNYSQGAVWL